MHLLSALLFLLLLLRRVAALETVIGLYGETVAIPCNYGAKKAEDINMIKWKFDKGDGQPGDLLVKQKDQNVSLLTTDNYQGRVSMAANFTLLLSEAKLADSRTFTCMLVTMTDIQEFPVNVLINKLPAGVEISDKAKELEFGKLTKLGTCVARDANPAANITWLRNNKPLVADGKGISIRNSVAVDAVTGLSTTSSTLEYSAEKVDSVAQFACRADHPLGNGLVSSPVTFTITYSTENISLQVVPQNPVDGDDLTLKCVADGNPAPTSFNFDLKGNVVKVENKDFYTISNISRNSSGVYKCSLIDDPSMEASRNVTVNYLDINLNPSGKIVKRAGEALDITLQIDSSAKSKVHWTKDNVKRDNEPKFTKLTYSDSGLYECEVTMENFKRKASFELVVEGAPIIKNLKETSEGGHQKILTCVAEGSPKPAVSWSINGTLLNETSFSNNKIEHKIAVVPSANLTVSCTVSNEFGIDTKVINVSSHTAEDGSQTQLVVGVVVGLLIAAVVIALVYWLYMKKSKQGSWKTGEKENGSSEEEKKLEENSQKAEV
ncbi:CD166 antigen homolog A isoform X2 [Kryptolebias marmoratus]|uniref:Activated leukocyte cell adhesion molecule b n=1 Tax=Kryptolebias marmoratus TaxID=37003 RepID=A0A3Q3BAT8_KRYMA|nr:CD166 antigen homolog A isoform X2 [Kryptolebias marmoratus]